jgi:hypothetical protein
MAPRHSSTLNNSQEQQLPRTCNGSFKGKKQQSFLTQRLKQLDVQTVLFLITKHRRRIAWALLIVILALLQVALLKRAYKHHVYKTVVRKNHQTLSRRGGPPPSNAWWRNVNLTIFTIWIGDDITPPPVIQAAMESCRNVHEDTPNLRYKVITNDDLDATNLGFELHPSFWLLDNVEKSDYLRGELLHVHGGFYMDADMVCLTNFNTVLLNSLVANAAQDLKHYGPWPSVSQNCFGPFQANSSVTTKWHDMLFETMDRLTPQLQQCASDHGGEIPYPTSRRWGTSLCGVEWGGVIDFVKPVWLEFFNRGEMGHDLSMCDVYGNHVGWDDYPLGQKCDVVHLGTAGDFYQRKEWNMEKMCREMPALYNSVHCQQGNNKK